MKVKLVKEKSVKKIEKFIPIFKEFMGMYWFIKNSGLYNKFLEFYKDFNLEKIDNYKQNNRKLENQKYLRGDY